MVMVVVVMMTGRSGVVSLSDEEDSRWPPSTAGSTRNANTAQERRTSGPEDDADEETSHKGTPLRKKAFLDDALILTSMTTTVCLRRNLLVDRTYSFALAVGR